MKKYLKEIIIILIQLIIFYILPLFAGPTDIMGLIVLTIILTFITSVIIGILSDNKKKLLYPLIVGIIFIPSNFIYYNNLALIYSLWFFIDSSIGLIIGTTIRIIIKKLSSH